MSTAHPQDTHKIIFTSAKNKKKELKRFKGSLLVYSPKYGSQTSSVSGNLKNVIVVHWPKNPSFMPE